MKKKTYIKPEIEIYGVETESVIAQSPGSNHGNNHGNGNSNGNNGNHYGWDKNPPGHGHGKHSLPDGSEEYGDLW